MTFIREINQWPHHSLETCRNHFSLCSFGLGKVTNEIGFQGKNYKAEVLVLSFAFVLGMCAIVTYLF
jgi:NADH-quinone oxidoreductase subunit L